MESETRRSGYHDFKAYTEQLTCGKYQGFVVVRHHTFAGTIQRVFRAGRPTAAEEEAFAHAALKVDVFIALLSKTPPKLNLTHAKKERLV
ncbi:hypothetical protein [Cupriavidus sp. AcVe19-6a]|uniref:hypothetical protein n=1 Tax=Cupriavidus sp. AcVe19-6a TaxID=2821358 RepID=UPI001AE8AE61|nr:hypothetical protein [Cupriavidus sp. AcVe19-6a]MBP0639100.1 hypothetical protein [Cupriavidus sp. AcVe19-6a]